MKQNEQTNQENLDKMTEHFWDDPEKIIRLIDLLFLFDDPDRKQICS